jgi:O-antigen/teichoic acid export membrane protein
MNLFRNAFMILATSVLGVPVQLITGVILARYLSVEDRGLYAVAITFAVTLALLVELGWGPAAIYRLRRAGAPRPKVATTALAAALAVSVAAALLCIPFESSISARFLDGAPPRIFYLALVIAPFSLIFIVFSSIARALDRFALQSGILLASNLGRLAAIAIVLVAWGGALEEALTAYLLIQAASTLCLIASVLYTTGIQLRVDLREIQATLRFGVRSYVGRTAWQLHGRVPIFLLAYLMADPSELAFFAVAASVATMLRMLPEAIGGALFPQLAGLDESQVRVLAARACRHGLLWVGGSLVAAGAVAPFAIPLLYGEPYAASTVPFLVLLPGVWLYAMQRVFSNYFAALGHLSPVIRSQVLATMLNVALSLWLIPLMGILGAALATLVSFGVGVVLLTWSFLLHSKCGLRETFVFRSEDLDPYRRRLERRLRPLLRRLGAG